MVSINHEGWNRLTDEQRQIINKIIGEFAGNQGESESETAVHEEISREIEHWFTGEL